MSKKIIQKYNKAEATYQYLPEIHGCGMFFYTDCCHNQMYSVNNDPLTYHGKLCPKCFWENRLVTLYLRGTEEANRVFTEREGQARIENGENIL